MPEYRRCHQPGGVYFFTLVTHLRRQILTSDLGRRCLHTAIAKVQSRRPFEIDAVVLLPDHLHMMWRLPQGDSDYSTRWRRIKEEFTRAWLADGGPEAATTVSRRRRQHRGIWQSRFWEHTIDGEKDYESHFDYIHYNPVKHGLVECPRDWPYSSFHRWVKEGVYDADWGCSCNGAMTFNNLDASAME